MRKQSLRGLVSAALRNHGHRPLSSAEWARLEDEGEEWLSSQPPEELAGAVQRERARRRAIPAAGQTGLTAPDGVSAYVTAMSYLIVSRERQATDVLAFRSMLLAEELVQPEALATWIDAWPPGPGELLAFPADGPYARRVRVQPGGVLDQLRKLAIEVAGRTGWQEQQAVAFIVSDTTPLLPVITVTEHRSSMVPLRVTLTVDAEMPPELVAAAFAAARRRLLGGERVRPVSRRNAELVAFVAERYELPWPVLWGSWNREHPEEAVRSVQVFRQTARRVADRLGFEF